MTDQKKPNQGAVGCFALAVVAAGMLYSRCTGDKPVDPAGRTPEKVAEDNAKAEAASRAPAPAPTEQVVTAVDMGEKWPFTVPAGTLKCVGRGAWRPIIFTVGSASYSINGTSKGRDTVARYNLHEVRPIWRDDTSVPGLKISMGPIIDLGHKLCPPD